jgi:hypothetical protein
MAAFYRVNTVAAGISMPSQQRSFAIKKIYHGFHGWARMGQERIFLIRAHP